jgi:hypothetical protein
MKLKSHASRSLMSLRRKREPNSETKQKQVPGPHVQQQLQNIVHFNAGEAPQQSGPLSMGHCNMAA